MLNRLPEVIGCSCGLQSVKEPTELVSVKGTLKPLANAVEGPANTPTVTAEASAILVSQQRMFI
jgi:hypothetical protein